MPQLDHMHRILCFSFSPLLLLTWLPIIPVALSKAVNRSIDDTFGDSVTGQKPLYLPLTVGIWEDATCKECALRPSIQDAYDQTWTAATYHPKLGNMSISFPFTGTAIYVFFILANISSHNSTTATNFTLDGVLVEGAYIHIADPDAPAFQFNESALAFAQTGLENSTHNLIISTSGDETIFVNFDYALYTFEEEDDTSVPSSSSTDLSSATGSSTTSTTFTTSKHSDSSKGAIVGGIIGGLLALCALTSVTFIYYRHQRRRIGVHQDEMPSIIPYRSRSTYYIPSSNLPSTKQLSMMHRLSNVLSSRPIIASSSPAPDGTLRAERHRIRQLEVQRQMRATAIRPMTEPHRIAFSQSRQNSAWARGLSDEPPPGYTSG